MDTARCRRRSRSADGEPAPPHRFRADRCGTIERVDAVEKSNERWSRAAGVLLAVAVGVAALLVLPNFIGTGECEGGGDCPDIVTREGTEFVLMFECDALPSGLRRSPKDGVMNSALYRAPETDVSTFAIEGLPADEVIAVEGSKDRGLSEGSGAGLGRGLLVPDGCRNHRPANQNDHPTLIRCAQ
jgi:hypothetical protein